ncbi:MAG: N-acetylmuramoyl-L-alanine amidase [Alphaproteobacteria bacterium]|nr:N-acetylmuramoyl-L-alanine amidase [Alphaproteobacteria bacterium]
MPHLVALALGLGSAAFAGAFDPQFAAAAEEYQVPEPLLKALAFEASRMNPNVATPWGGYGLFDFREDNETFGPGIEQVSMLIDVSPDDVIAEPALQIRGAAALLAWHARNANGGALPDADDLEAWDHALVAFSGRQEPNLQEMFVSHIYELTERGFMNDGAMLDPVSVAPRLDWILEGAPPPLPVGDYAGNAQFISADPSNYSDYSRGPSDIDIIVIHMVQGSYSGCISWFQNSAANVSAHYVVRQNDGEVTQMVLEEDVGWHAGNWDYNLRSVGIEHEGYVEDSGLATEYTMYQGSAALAADIAARNNIPIDRSHIIGHVEVPNATHTDPGPYWDWTLYMALIEAGGGTVGAELIGKIAHEDIYTGAALSGATVTLDQTGETFTTGSDGLYRFPDLSAGTWSVTVAMNGYESGACVKDIEAASGQWWCSVALFPGEDPVDDTGEPVTDDTGDTGGGPIDSDPHSDPPDVTPGERPGARVAISELQTGRCASAPGLLGAWWLVLLALGRRRC